MRRFIFPLVFLCLFCSGLTAATLNESLSSALSLLNDGQVLESYLALKEYEATHPSEKEAVFLVALAKWRLMWLSAYTASDRKELLVLLNRVDELCAPHIEDDNDALFYAAAVTGVRAQLAATENQWWQTAQLGKKMKSQATELLDRDSEYYPAYYLLGSYNYFADALPGYVKFLRTLVFLPGGDRTKGLKQLIIAYEKGGIVSAEAGRTLAIIYTHFEKRFDYGLQMCDNILQVYPRNYEVSLYKGINLYFDRSWEKSEQWFERLARNLAIYSRRSNRHNSLAVSPYTRMVREVHYRMARCLIQQKRYEPARSILMDLAEPPLHEPYWIMRGVSLSLAYLDYEAEEFERAEDWINTVLQWKDVMDSHEKAKELREQRTDIDSFVIDFL